MGEETRQGADAARQPYDGVRILDLTRRFGLYAGRLFADLGAEVILVEPPEGLADRPGGPNGDAARFAFLNASKKSVVIDEAAPGARAALERLVERSDVVLLERGGPLYGEVERIRTIRPQAVVTAISPYGMTGPLADAPASDLVLQAAGGIAWMSGRTEEAPLSLPFDQATMVGSIYAATVTAIALADAERTGRGHLIDVSVQECIAHSLQNAVQVWDLEGRISTRGGAGTRDASEDIFPCRDGYVFLASPLSLGASWRSLVGWMVESGHPSGDALSQDRWADREWRLTPEARSAFRALFCAFTAERDKEALTREALVRRIVMGPVNRLAETFEDPQLLHRGFYRPVALPEGGAVAFPGPPYKLDPQVWSVSPAPALGSEDVGRKEHER
jgi:benzylsuccinate CoA-transferase BbsE subunit